MLEKAALLKAEWAGNQRHPSARLPTPLALSLTCAEFRTAQGPYPLWQESVAKVRQNVSLTEMLLHSSSVPAELVAVAEQEINSSMR